MSQASHPPVTPGPLDPEFSGRRVGLIVFGVVSIVLGALSGCFGLVALVPLFMPGSMMPPGQPPPDPRGVAMGFVIYALVSAALIWCGIGSVQRRRWVRPMMLIIAWTWLLAGIPTTAIVALSMNNLDVAMRATNPAAPPLPAGAKTLLYVFTIAFSTFVFVVLPLVLVIVYQPTRTRLALEADDPQTRWTDRVPLPVLGLSVGLAMAAVSVLFGLAYNVIPVFGMLVTGVPAAVIILATAALCAWLAVETYRLRWVGWWGTLVLSVLLCVNGVVSMMRISMYDFYRAIDVPEDQARLMEEMAVDPRIYAVLFSVMGVACVGYAVYVRRFFGPSMPAIPA
jgi:hypothetical protein